MIADTFARDNLQQPPNYLRRRCLRMAASLVVQLAFFSATFAVSATEVTLRLVDQNQVLIPGTMFQVQTAGRISVPQQGTVSLPAGIHSILLSPGIEGRAVGGGILERQETLNISGSAQTVQFVWKTAVLKVSLVDQNDATIPNSQIRLGSYSGSNDFRLTDSPSGTTVQLPVTEDPDSTPIVGVAANGYGARLLPGLNGPAPGGVLERIDPPVELTSAGAIRKFVWKTAPVTVSLVDQNDLPIPSSQIRLGSYAGGNNFRFTDTASGATVQLPVTEDPDSTPITGVAANGYGARLLPGLNGPAPGGVLERIDPAVELTPAGAIRKFVWKTAQVTVSLVDQNDLPIPGSQIRLGSYAGSNNFRFTDTPSGATVRLPVTDDPDSAPISGVAANGYGAKLLPGINGPIAGGLLERTDPAVELTSTGAIRKFVWQVARGTLRLVDCAGAEISGASFILNGALAEMRTGTLVGLPVNDRSIYATLSGIFSNGYPFSIRLTPTSTLTVPISLKLASAKVLTPRFFLISDLPYSLRFDI